ERPIANIAPTFGGFSNLTMAATIGERRCVVKAAQDRLKRADVRREARMLAMLRDSGLPIPQLLALVEDREWTVAVTGFVGGEHGLQVYQRAPPGRGAIFRALGRLLAAVHRIPPPLERRSRNRTAKTAKIAKGSKMRQTKDLCVLCGEYSVRVLPADLDLAV